MIVKRRFVIKCGEYCEDLLNKIMENLKVGWLKAEIKGNSIYLEVRGLPYELKDAWYLIQDLKREISLTKNKGERALDSSTISKLARATAPLDALQILLSQKGYRAKVEGGVLITSAPMDLVVELTRKYFELSQDEVVRFKVKGNTGKKFVILASLTLEMSPEEVINLAIDMGLMKEGDFKYELTKDWRQALKEIIRKSKESSV